MQVPSPRPAYRTGAAQFPTMRGLGRSTEDFAHYLTAWCETPHALPADDANEEASPVSSPSASPASPVTSGAVFLNGALVARDNQLAPTPTPRVSRVRGRGGATSSPTPAGASGAAPDAAPIYPHVYNVEDFAHGSWDAAIHDAIQWLAEGASHQSSRHNALASTSSCQYAMDAVLAETYCDSEEFAAELGQAVPVETFTGSLVVLCFHPHASVCLWARQALLGLVQSASWATDEQEPSRELVRLLALWKFALCFLSTIKHLQVVRFEFETTTSSGGEGSSATPSVSARTSLDKDRLRCVVRGFYHVLVVLTSLDAKLTAATEAARRGGSHTTATTTTAASSSPADAPQSASCVPVTHPTTALLLGGSLLLYWFFGAYDVLLREASGLLRAQAMRRRQQQEDEDADEESDGQCANAQRDHTESRLGSAPAGAQRMERRTMHLLVSALNERLRGDTTLAPASLAVDVKKAIVKVLVHTLLDNARGQPLRKEDAEWRLQRMQRLWLFALEVDPPTSTVAVKKDGSAAFVATTTATPPVTQVPVHNAAQWMFRALLRNAEIQLRIDEAVTEARSHPRAHPAQGPASTSSAAGSVLPDAVFALFALFTSLEKVASPHFLGSAFLHDILVEQEQTIFSIAVGGIVRLRSIHAVDLYAFLLRADVHYFFPEADGADAAAAASTSSTAGSSHSGPVNAAAVVAAAAAKSRAQGSQAARRGVPLQRCWTNYPTVLKQMVKVAVPGELFVCALEALSALVDHPPCCVWLLTNPDLASSLAPFGWNVQQLLAGVAQLLTENTSTIQDLWQHTEEKSATSSSSSSSSGGAMIVSGARAQDPSVVFIASAASSARSVAAGGASPAAQRWPSIAHGANSNHAPIDVVAATSRLLALHPQFPRLVQTLHLGEDHVLQQTAAALAAVFLSTVSESVLNSFMTDAADAIYQHGVLTQSALGGDHFLRMDEPSVNNVARAQSGLWVRAMVRCNWRGLSVLFACVAWWLCERLLDLVALSLEDRQELLDKVVMQLPALVSASPLSAGGAGHDTGAPSASHTRMQLSRYVQEAEDAALAGLSDDAPPSHVYALRASPLLYDVLSRLLLTLLKKHTQFRVETLTSTMLYVAGALPAPRAATDTRFAAALQKALVPVCEQLPASDVETLKQYAPAWLSDALRRAGQTIDECLAEQDRRFAQFEWEEKQLAQATVDQQRRDVEDGVVARQNIETLHQQAVRDRTQADQKRATSATSLSRLNDLALGVKRERDESDSEQGGRTGPHAELREGEETGWLQAKRHRDALEQQVATLLGKTPKPTTSATAAAGATVSVSTTPAASRPGSSTAPITAPPQQRKPTVLQQRLQAVNAQHAEHANHVQNQGDLESTLRRVAASTNLSISPAYTGDIIGPEPTCLAREVPVLPSVFTDPSSTAVVGPTATATARGIQQWAATGRLYANRFGPHIALELRCDIVRSFEEWFDQCRHSGFIQVPSGGAVLGSAAKTARPLSVAERFPLNAQVAGDASMVTLTANTVSLVDALNPLEMTFTVQSVDHGVNRYGSIPTNNNNNTSGSGGGGSARRAGKGRTRTGGPAPLFVDFTEGDVVLALLPLSALLPHWIAFQRERGKTDGVVYGMAEQEALLAAVPPMWRVLGCLPHVCYVKSLIYGQRTATLATYPSAAPRTTTTTTTTMATTQRMTFQHALQVGFRDGYQVPFYLFKLSSLGQAFTSVNALHRIYETHFARTLYDPRRSATESQRYASNVHQYCIEAQALPALRARMLLQSTLNVWQAQAVLAVLYAAVPSWDRSPVLDTAVRGHDSASAAAVAVSPITMANDATAQLFFGHSSVSGAGADPKRVAAASTTAAHATPLFRGTRIPDVLLIEGPPGTGKTQTIAVLVLNLLLHLPSGSRVLLCAPSNCAVDEALLRVQRLQHRLTARHSPVAQSSVGYGAARLSHAANGKLIRVGVRGSVDEAVLRSLPPVFVDDLVDQAMAAHEKGGGRAATNSNNNNNNGDNNRNLHNRRLAVKEHLLRDAAVVFSTLGSLNHVQRHGHSFDVVVVDEASQGTEPDVLQALMLAKHKVVLVGDSKQLQPTILCKEAARCGLRRSLLVRLLQNNHQSFLLRTQYRMHPDICAFPNGYFYGAKLRTDPSVLTRIQAPRAASSGARRPNTAVTTPSVLGRSVGQKLGELPRFVFINVADGAMTGGRGHSLRNQREAYAVVQHMRQLRSFLRMTVQEFGQYAGIITYYSAQRDTIWQLLTNEERYSGLQIATVDSFQGKEKDIILISCVRTLRPEQVEHLEKFVAAHRHRQRTASPRPDSIKLEEVKNEEGEEEDTEALLSQGQPLFQTVPEEDVDGADLADGDSHVAAAPALQSVHHRATLGFLSDWHRINVSLTRARELCIVYGHQPTIELAAAVASTQNPAAAATPPPADAQSALNENADGPAAARDRETLLRALEAADEDPALLYEMVSHAARPNITSARLAAHERSGRLSLGSLSPETTTKPRDDSVEVVDVDADDEESPSVTSSPVPGFTIAGRRQPSPSVESTHRCRAACLTYELRDNLLEILASYRS